jgi:hypothetical protein
MVRRTAPFGLDIASDRDSLERNPTEAPLVPVMFDHYVNRQAGSSALAGWLNEQGYRTKSGRLWSSASVITVLRNRAYSARFTTAATGIPQRTSR